MIERNNTSVTLDRIFEDIYNLVTEANRIPLTDKVIIEANDLADALDELKAAIPKEVRNASQVLEEQKSIVNKAYEEADRIVQQAKSEAERIVGVANAEADRILQEEEIVKQANAVAEDIKANALRYQEEMKREADDYAVRVKQDSLQYADDMLAYLGSNLQSALQGLADNRSSILAEQKNLEERSNQAVAVLEEQTE
ncbi:MAG: hypothetical protein IJW91_00485 [Phascolarctobacterium sp.]|nr:hypothetical protein [Phascolarctobacterium sp.]MBQ7884353.1 hypothetical protein [Phascolarctobacterium sp.]